MQSRNIRTTIQEMLQETPKVNLEFRIRLAKISDASLYAAPELQWLSWQKLQDAVLDYLGDPKEEWEYKVWSIFTTKPVEEINRLG